MTDWKFDTQNYIEMISQGQSIYVKFIIGNYWHLVCASVL